MLFTFGLEKDTNFKQHTERNNVYFFKDFIVLKV